MPDDVLQTARDQDVIIVGIEKIEGGVVGVFADDRGPVMEEKDVQEGSQDGALWDSGPGGKGRGNAVLEFNGNGAVGKV